LDEEIKRAKCIYDQHRGRPTLQKDREDNKKCNMEKRKKGNMPPFFINNSQGKPTLNEPEMSKHLGKRTRKQPIKFWGCERENMYRDFPHRG
jgi:hypothetical protein